MAQVLADVQYRESELIKSMKEQVERAVKEGRLKPSEGVKLLDDYEAGMKEYTYLDCNGRPASDVAAAELPANAKPKQDKAASPPSAEDRPQNNDPLFAAR